MKLDREANPPAIGRTRNRRRDLLILAGLVVGLSACDDSGSDHKKSDGSDGRRVVHGDATHEQNWLEPGAKTSTASWLAARTTKEGDPSPARVQEIGELLDTADRDFLESDRMIANRSLQLVAMLHEAGIEEDPIALIQAFTALPADKEGVRSYTKTCELYFNLRRSGSSQAAALKVLSMEQ